MSLNMYGRQFTTTAKKIEAHLIKQNMPLSRQKRKASMMPPPLEGPALAFQGLENL